MRRGGSRSWCRWALGLCLVLASAGASAQLTPVTSQSLFLYQAGNTYGGDYLALDGGVIYTDNVQRIAGGSSQTLLLAGLSGNASHEGTNLDFHLLSNLAVVKYIPGAFPTGPSGYLDGMLKLKIVPGF